MALACRELSTPCVIVLPSTAPQTKIEATRGYGAEIVHHDLLGEGREAATERLARERGLTIIPPFDHPDIIAGQGTAAAELFEDYGPLDLLLVPVGGGGLISGSALATRACVSDVSRRRGRARGRRRRRALVPRRHAREHRSPDTIADGARTTSLGAITFELIRRYVADMTTVPDAALIEAMAFVWTRLKIVVEPTGVLGLAALLSGRVRANGERVGVIVSGGNVDLASARAWLAPAEQRALASQCPEQPAGPVPGRGR